MTGHRERYADSHLPPASDLLTPGEVAVVLRCDPKTVTRWARAGKLTALRTLGGHRRYFRAEVEQILHGRHPSQSQEW